MKRIHYILAAAVLTLSLTGCGKSAPIATVTTETTSPTPPLVTTVPVETTQATEAPTEFTIPETEPAPTGVIGVVNNPYVNVREQAGANSKLVTKLTSGTQVTIWEQITKEGTSWGHIDQGWVSMDYIQLESSPASSVPSFTQTSVDTCEESPNPCSGGHTWGGWETILAPTSSTTGTARRVCSQCGREETKTLPATTPSHTHQYSKSVTKPGCTSEGFTTYTCSCGDSYQGDFVAATGHSWNGWVTTKEPTAISTGLKERKCQNCSAPQTEVIPKLTAPTEPAQPEAHTHTYGLAVEVSPTCTADGYYIRKCTVCGSSERKPSYKPANGHSYSIVSSAPADCTHNGSATYQCSICGDTYSETTSAAHSWVHHHEDAVTHTEVYVRCHCGWSASYDGGAGIDAYMAHQDSVPPEELNSHSYYTPSETVVDVPARDYEQCSVCGTTK